MIKNSLYDFVNQLSPRGKVSLIVAVGIMAVFFGMQTLIVLGFLRPSYHLSLYGYACFIGFCPAFILLLRDYHKRYRERILEEQQLQNLITEFRDLSGADKVPDIYNQACIISKTPGATPASA